jgi:hypothetical protein
VPACAIEEQVRKRIAERGSRLVRYFGLKVIEGKFMKQILLLVLLTANGVFGDNPIKFKNITISKSMDNTLIKKNNLRLSIPERFQMLKSQDQESYYFWGYSEDVKNAVSNDPNDIPKNGFFKIYLNDGAGIRDGVFSIENGLEAQLKDIGCQDIKIEKFMAKGYPILNVSAWEKEVNRTVPIHLVYIGLNDGTWVLTVAYSTPELENEHDDLIWETLIKSLRNQGSHAPKHNIFKDLFDSGFSKLFIQEPDSDVSHWTSYETEFKDFIIRYTLPANPDHLTNPPDDKISKLGYFTMFGYDYKRSASIPDCVFSINLGIWSYKGLDCSMTQPPEEFKELLLSKTSVLRTTPSPIVETKEFEGFAGDKNEWVKIKRTFGEKGTSYQYYRPLCGPYVLVVFEEYYDWGHFKGKKWYEKRNKIMLDVLNNIEIKKKGIL